MRKAYRKLEGLLVIRGDKEITESPAAKHN